MKKIKNLIMTLLLVLGLVGLTTLHSEAASKIKPTMSLDDTVLLCEGHYFGSSIEGVPNNKYKITSVVSSKPDVIAVDKKQTNKKSFYLRSVKAGKSKITVKVKVGEKTYTLKKVVEIVDDKPFQYIKYNGKDVYKGNEYKNPWLKPKSGKVLEWKVKKGYKVINAYFYDGYGSSKKIKSGTKINLKNTCYPLVVFFIQNPDKKTFYYAVGWLAD